MGGSLKCSVGVCNTYHCRACDGHNTPYAYVGHKTRVVTDTFVKDASGRNETTVDERSDCGGRRTSVHKHGHLLCWQSSGGQSPPEPITSTVNVAQAANDSRLEAHHPILWLKSSTCQTKTGVLVCFRQRLKWLELRWMLTRSHCVLSTHLNRVDCGYGPWPSISGTPGRRHRTDMGRAWKPGAPHTTTTTMTTTTTDNEMT